MQETDIPDGVGQIEDHRNAASIAVSLVEQLLNAALAALGVLGAFSAYALAQRDVKPAFVPLTFIAALFFISGVYAGVKGAGRIIRAGQQGHWDRKYGSIWFRRQAIFCMLGIAFFAFAIVASGPSTSEQMEKDLEILEGKILVLEERLNNSVKSLEDEMAILREQMDDLQQSNNSLTNELVSRNQEVEDLSEQLANVEREHDSAINTLQGGLMDLEEVVKALQTELAAMKNVTTTTSLTETVGVVE